MVRQYIQIQNELVQKYKIALDPKSTCRRRTHAHVKERRICKWCQKNSVQSTFDLLHEIGHVETTKSSMRRCEAEFYATQWAIDRAKEYDIAVPESVIKVYQDYIDLELARGVRRHGRGYNINLNLKAGE